MRVMSDCIHNESDDSPLKSFIELSEKCPQILRSHFKPLIELCMKTIPNTERTNSSDLSQKSTRDQNNSKQMQSKNSSKSDSGLSQNPTPDPKNSKKKKSNDSSVSDSDLSENSTPDQNNSKKNESKNLSFGNIRQFSDNLRSHSIIQVNIDIVLSELMTIQFNVVMAPLIHFWSKREVSLFLDALHQEFCGHNIITTNQTFLSDKILVYLSLS